jgi:hypothetical protein
VRAVLDREKHGILVEAAAGMNRIRWDVENATRTHPVCFSLDDTFHLALQHEDSLLVGMVVGFRNSLGRHPHQCDDHSVAFDDSPEDGRVGWSTFDLIEIV